MAAASGSKQKPVWKHTLAGSCAGFLEGFVSMSTICISLNDVYMEGRSHYFKLMHMYGGEVSLLYTKHAYTHTHIM